jgi:hypothetical protein
VDCSLRGGATDDAVAPELESDAVNGVPPGEYFCAPLDGADNEVESPVLDAVVEIPLPVFLVEAAERLPISLTIADFFPASDDDVVAVPARVLGLGAGGAAGGLNCGGLKFGRDGEFPRAPVEAGAEPPAPGLPAPPADAIAVDGGTSG